MRTRFLEGLTSERRFALLVYQEYQIAGGEHCGKYDRYATDAYSNYSGLRNSRTAWPKGTATLLESLARAYRSNVRFSFSWRNYICTAG